MVSRDETKMSLFRDMFSVQIITVPHVYASYPKDKDIQPPHKQLHPETLHNEAEIYLLHAAV